jgi:hypothetical protein
MNLNKASVQSKRMMELSSLWKSKNAVLQLGFIAGLLLLGCNTSNGQKNKERAAADSAKKAGTPVVAVVATVTPAQTAAPIQPLDTAKYNKAMMWMVNDSGRKGWPVKSDYPLAGAILPFNRIVAYYGNFYSTRMGALGEYEPTEMLRRLGEEVKKWQKADSLTPVIPAIHYIAVTAQGQPGKGNTYRMRMPFAQIDKALEIAKRINAIVFLDVQVGQSTLQQEIPQLEKYLIMPHVHLAIDPEFSMKTGRKPGSIIGTFDAADINYVSDYLTNLVKKNNLPPKILCVHRFTKGMVTNYKNIKLHREIQIVMDMDGWGFPAKKVSSYHIAIVTEPVQFTGFKLFYKNDIITPPYKKMMTPEEVLSKLYPKPVYIQYQ